MNPRITRPALALFLGLAVAAMAPAARANVYASNVRLNGATNNVSINPGGSVNINYILNEAASSGVTIEILSASNTVVRTISIASPNAGTTRGTNTVTWNGQDGSNVNVPSGSYSIRVTAAATGYGGWTQITTDTNVGQNVYDGRGIAVNQNTNSFYYGRVFVGNSLASPGLPVNDGDKLGIQKLNADGSPAADGRFSTGGYPWTGDESSPWKLEVSADDKVYVNDWTTHGTFVTFNQLLTTNAYQIVLRGDADNNPNGGAASLSGIFVTGAGTNSQIWATDVNFPNDKGILRWGVTGNGTCATNDTGTQIVSSHGSSDLNLYAQDVAVDSSNRIYTIQFVAANNSTAPRVLRFPAYTNLVETNADWKVGQGSNTMRGAFAVAVDPAAQYVAVAFRDSSGSGSGGLGVFSATDGSLISMSFAPLDDFTDVAWDRAGNLYAIDNSAVLPSGSGVWRVYSPPGANSSVTPSLATVQVAPPTPPVITSIGVSSGTVTINFTGAVTDVPGAFTLVNSTTVSGTYTNTPGANITGASGTYQATAPVSGSVQFYRIKR